MAGISRPLVGSSSKVHQAHQINFELIRLSLFDYFPILTFAYHVNQRDMPKPESKATSTSAFNHSFRRIHLLVNVYHPHH